MEVLGPPKTLKNQWFFKVFANVGFRYFGALDGPHGLILAPLGPICSQIGSQHGSPDCSESTQDGLSWRTRGTGSACRSYLKSFFFLEWLQNASRWPREAQDILLGNFLDFQRLSSKALAPEKHYCCCYCGWCCCRCCCCRSFHSHPNDARSRCIQAPAILKGF